MPRGLPLRCATLNFSWEANSTKVLSGSKLFRNVELTYSTGIPKRDGKFSSAYRRSARALVETKADVLLLQEVSVATTDFRTLREVANSVSTDLFSGKYNAVGFKMDKIKQTWFGNMVLVTRELVDDYDFLDLQSCDFYSGSTYFSGGNALCAVMMTPKATPQDPAMLLCSAHSKHGQKWDNSSTQKLFEGILRLSMSAFKRQIPGARFDQMGVIFGGDLNTTNTNKCDWGGAVRFKSSGQTFTMHKTSSRHLKQNTLTLDGKEDFPVPRDWIFSTSSVADNANPQTLMINSVTGSDHYAVMVQTKSAMSDYTHKLTHYKSS